MASAAVVLPEPLPPENRLMGPKSNSPLGMLPQWTRTNRLRNTRGLARGWSAAVRRQGIDGFVAHEIDDHGMHANPRLRLLQVVVFTIVDQLQPAQALEHAAALGRFFRQAAAQPVFHRETDGLQRLAGVTAVVEL